jgi:hypothetical protein
VEIGYQPNEKGIHSREVPTKTCLNTKSRCFPINVRTNKNEVHGAINQKEYKENNQPQISEEKVAY